MENKRKQLADDIKSTVQHLNELIEQAKAQGLYVEIDTSISSLAQSHKYTVAVKIMVITEY